jgi:hypothetical protein
MVGYPTYGALHRDLLGLFYHDIVFLAGMH